MTSLHQTLLKRGRFSHQFPESARLMERVITLISEMRKLKSSQALSLKTELSSLTIYAEDQKVLDALKSQVTLISGISQAKEMFLVQGALGESALTKKDDAWHMALKA